MQIFKSFLVFIIACSAGCGTCFTHLIELAPIDEPYAGTKHDLKCLARLVACKEPINVILTNDPSPQKTSIKESLYRVFCITVVTIDTPLSFVADTLFLPFQAYWYLNPDVEQSKAQDDLTVERVEDR